MPTAFHWFSEFQEIEKQRWRIYVSKCFISIRLSKRFEIKYEESDGSTRVCCERAKRDVQVEGNMIQVFSDDLNEFLLSRRHISQELAVMSSSKIEDFKKQIIFECIELALKSRSEKLRLRSIRFKMFTEKQVIALLQFINPELLTIIHFDSPVIDVSFLSNWNRGCRLEAEFKCAKDSAINLESVEKMLNLPTTFSRIKVFYRNKDGWSKEKLFTFFKHPFTIRAQNLRRRKYIEINLKDPIENLTKQIDDLSLQYTRSLEVLANPSLMKMIVKGFQCFDIQTLRKVSRDVRSCIDHLKLDPQISMYKIKRILDRRRVKREHCPKEDFPDTFDIFLEPKNAKMKCISFRSRKSLQIENDWHVDKFIYSGDPLEKVVNDFDINIRHQRSKMDYLILDYDEKLLELIGNVLKSRETPLNVKYLRMKVKNQSDIMNILPYLGSVESIAIEFNSTGILSLNDVSKLDQWKNATGLSVRRVFDYLKTE